MLSRIADELVLRVVPNANSPINQDLVDRDFEIFLRAHTFPTTLPPQHKQSSASTQQSFTRTVIQNHLVPNKKKKRVFSDLVYLLDLPYQQLDRISNTSVSRSTSGQIRASFFTVILPVPVQSSPVQSTPCQCQLVPWPRSQCALPLSHPSAKSTPSSCNTHTKKHRLFSPWILSACLSVCTRALSS